MRTVALPFGKILTTNGCADDGGIEHWCVSNMTAAGAPPILTVGTPGPVIEPPCVVLSLTLAAAGIFLFFN
jgi:hypothetical protein